MIWKDIGPLKCYCELKQSKKALVLFHGYGTNAYNLEDLKLPFKDEAIDVIFPQAFRPLDIEPNSWAWIDIDFEKIKNSSTEDELENSILDPNQIQETREKVHAFHSSLLEDYDDIILGGFSQGGMIAADIALVHPKPPKAIVVFSSTARSSYDKNEVNKLTNYPVFQSHGRQDEIINFKLGKNLNEFLKELGCKTELIPFEGGHEIPSFIIQEFGKFVLKSF